MDPTEQSDPLPSGYINVPGVGACIVACDFIANVCGKDRVYGQNHISRLLNSKSEDARNLAMNIFSRKALAPGTGIYGETYVLTYQEAVKLLTLLPHKYTLRAMDEITRQFTRIRAGDTTLIPEVMQRAAADDIEAQTARDSLGITSTAVVPVLNEQEKQLTLREREAQITALELRNKQALMAMDMELEERRIQLEEKRIRISDMKVNTICKLSDLQDKLEANQIRFSGPDRELVKSMVTFDLRTMIKGTDKDGVELTTIAKEAEIHGYPSKDNAFLRKAGVVAARLYREKYKKDPERSGSSNPNYNVCTYTTKDRDIILEALEEAHVELYGEGGSQKKKQKTEQINTLNGYFPFLSGSSKT